MFLKKNPKVTTIVEKTEGFSGELRIPTTKYLAGEKTYIAHYKENDCTFKFDINKTYFSPRLSNERKVIADEVVNLTKKDSKILIMFAGISPYPIVIARKLKLKNKTFHVYANELNKQANISAKENIRINKLFDYITLIPGNANSIPNKLKQKFDIILMPRPNLKDTFLPAALKLSKKGTTIFYHGFGTKEEVLSEIEKETKGKIGKIKIRKAGDIGPYIFRWQAIFKVK